MSDFFRDLWRYMRTRKKFWLLPFLVVFSLAGALIALVHGTAAAPLIYTLF